MNTALCRRRRRQQVQPSQFTDPGTMQTLGSRLHAGQITPRHPRLRSPRTGSGWRTSQASSLKPPREWRICGVRVEGTTWAAIPSAEGSSQHGAALASMQRKTRSNNATSSRQGAHIQPAVCWLGCLELNLVEPANHPIIRHCTGVAGTTPLGEAQGPGQLGWRVLLKSCGAGSRQHGQQGSP